jgi:hypothetical protein
MPPAPRIRLEVALPATVHDRAQLEAGRRGQSLAAFIAETVEVALVPERCAHGVSVSAAAPVEPGPAEIP